MPKMPKIAVIYWSGSGNTEKIANLLAQGASAANATVSCLAVSEAAPDDLRQFDAVLLGSPALGDEEIEETEMRPFLEDACAQLDGRLVALFGSYGWGDGEWMRKWSASMQEYGVQMPEPPLTIKEAPEGPAEAICIAYGKKIAERA